jgi:3-deoxy-7-phosphoheptulonate synthase
MRAQLPVPRGASTLLILLKSDAATPEPGGVVEALRALGVAVEEVHLPGHRALAVVGDTTLPPDALERIPGVERVLSLEGRTGMPRVPLVMATLAHAEAGTNGRTPGTSGRTVELAGARFGGGQFSVIAGPCTVESDVELRHIAQNVRQAGAAALRGGVFKVRTSPHSYQGGGLDALDALSRVSREVGLPFFTELSDPRQVSQVGDRLDGVQIGARSMQNFPLLTEVAALGKPVILKRHMAAEVDDWLHAAEYLMSGGLEDVVLCERGVKSSGRHVRYMLDVGVIPFLKQRIGLPIIVDPSHAGGHHALVPALARAAVAAGADGLMVEVHSRPENTRCDAMQALPLGVFADLMNDVAVLAEMNGLALCGAQADRQAGQLAGSGSDQSTGSPLMNRSVEA